MSTIVPKLSSGGTVKIRFTSIELGTTRWREGTFEILEKDNKVSLCLRFNCGGATKTFQVYSILLYFHSILHIKAKTTFEKLHLDEELEERERYDNSNLVGSYATRQLSGMSCYAMNEFSAETRNWILQ